jgi:hypothetical protein
MPDTDSGQACRSRDPQGSGRNTGTFSPSTVRQISVWYGASNSTRAAFTREISRLRLSAQIDP